MKEQVSLTVICVTDIVLGRRPLKRKTLMSAKFRFLLDADKIVESCGYY